MNGRAIGVDGARGGWVIAELDSERGCTSLRFEATIAPTVAALASSPAVMVVDMPIGLSASGHRPVDVLAKARLGPRHATFFPTPVRDTLECAEWEQANEVSRARSGKGLSKQAWNLVPKIRELDHAWTRSRASQLFEGHPEISFAEMASGPVLAKKRTAAGLERRCELLVDHLDIDVRHDLAQLPNRLHEDALDALALAWTARRILCGVAVTLGGELDDRGRPMQLVI